VGESFVDLTYRGLPLGRRIKLTQIRPSSGYLELPAPMPVGTSIAIATDDGVSISAIVAQIHEQIGGSERPPGMVVAPALADAAAAAWWQERVTLPESEASEAAPQPVVVLPRVRGSGTTPPPIPTTSPAQTSPAASAPAASGAATPAHTPAVAAPSAPAPETELGASDSDAPIEDDGKKTVMMESVDLSALGLEAGASAQLSASSVAAAAEEEAEADEGEGEGDAGEGEADAAAPTDGEPASAAASAEKKKQFGKKRKKRR
jgi:hypothetical protein